MNKAKMNLLKLQAVPNSVQIKDTQHSPQLTLSQSPPRRNRRYTDNQAATSRSPSREEKSRNRPNQSITPSGTSVVSRQSMIPRSSLQNPRND